MPEEAVEPYYRRLKRLREQRGLSQPELYRHTEGVSFSTIVSLEQKPNHKSDAKRGRSRYPSAATLEAICRTLNVQPSVFPEYRLAKAREQLDERVQGLETALENYERWIASTGTGTAKAAARQAQRRAKRPPNRGETRNAKEGGR